MHQKGSGMAGSAIKCPGIIISLAALLSALWALSAFADTCEGPLEGETALAAAARGLVPGTSCELSAKGLTWDLIHGRQDCPSSHMLDYSSQGGYDPVRRVIHYIGGPHCFTGLREFSMYYDEAANTWSLNPPPPLPETMSAGHGYDNGVVDPDTGDFYFRAYASAQWHKLTDTVFTRIASVPSMTAEPSTGTAWDRKRQGIITLEDTNGILFWSKAKNRWSTIAGPQKMAGLGLKCSYHFWADYDDKTGQVWLWDGNCGSNAHWRLNTDGSVVTLAPIPPSVKSIGCCGGQGKLGTYDYRTGKFVIADPFSSHVWDYELATDTWRDLGDRVPLQQTFDIGDIMGFVTSIKSYGGVIVYVILNRGPGHDPTMYVYKHD